MPDGTLGALIHRFVAVSGRGLPAIVTIVIGVTLTRLGKNPLAALEQLRVWLYLHGSRNPLGVYDPLGYVSCFIKAFDEMLGSSQEELLDYKMFRLRGPRIIQGLTQGGRWQTIFAYCGGWLWINQKQRIRCGTDPLHLANSRHCDNCGRLVCPNCGFCSNNCDEYSTRQKGVFEERLKKLGCTGE